MSDISTMRSPAPGQRQATIFYACLKAASRGLALVFAGFAYEMRMLRYMRQLAAMDDHML